MKTPYINEFGGHVQAQTTIADDGSGTSKYNIGVVLNFFLYSEIINIYADPWPRANLTLKVNGSFTYDYDVGTLVPVSGASVPISIDVTGFNWIRY